MAAAARETARPARPEPRSSRPEPRTAPPELELRARRPAPTITVDENRPLPYPEPVGFNDNEDDVPAAPRTQRRRLGFVQIAARILIAPWYAVVVAGALGVIALFVRGWLAV